MNTEQCNECAINKYTVENLAPLGNLYHSS